MICTHAVCLEAGILDRIHKHTWQRETCPRREFSEIGQYTSYEPETRWGNFRQSTFVTSEINGKMHVREYRTTSTH